MMRVRLFIFYNAKKTWIYHKTAEVLVLENPKTSGL